MLELSSVCVLILICVLLLQNSFPRIDLLLVTVIIATLVSLNTISILFIGALINGRISWYKS